MNLNKKGNKQCKWSSYISTTKNKYFLSVKSLTKLASQQLSRQINIKIPF